jgi:hypothetical protein
MRQEFKALLAHQITKRVHTKPMTPTKPDGSDIEDDLSLKMAEEVMTSMHSKHTPLINDMNKMASEIATKIVSEPEEDLLWLLRQLLFHCYRVLT